jgi:gluconolactonase
MKIWRSTLCVAVAAILAGCQPAEQEAVAATPEPANTGTGWLCPAEPGTAPTGVLTAQRIAVTEASDDLPRLYEGPVWHDGSLYYSDFMLSEGFRSRIQRFTPPDRLETAIINSGSNGLALDEQGRIVAATHDRKELARYDVSERSRERIVGRSIRPMIWWSRRMARFTSPIRTSSVRPQWADRTRPGSTAMPAVK